MPTRLRKYWMKIVLNHTLIDIHVEAPDSWTAKKLAEAQYGKGCVDAGPEERR